MKTVLQKRIAANAELVEQSGHVAVVASFVQGQVRSNTPNVYGITSPSMLNVRISLRPLSLRRSSSEFTSARAAALASSMCASV
jgi:hypothetical protein